VQAPYGCARAQTRIRSEWNEQRRLAAKAHDFGHPARTFVTKLAHVANCRIRHGGFNEKPSGVLHATLNTWRRHILKVSRERSERRRHHWRTS
jgi:hypothetical protein